MLTNNPSSFNYRVSYALRYSFVTGDMGECTESIALSVLIKLV